MTNKLVVIINSLKLPKIKKILQYEMEFLVPNYSCLQNPWPESYCPQIPVLSILCPQMNLLNSPRKKNSWVRHWCNLGSKWRWVVCSTPRSPYPDERSPDTSQGRRSLFWKADKSLVSAGNWMKNCRTALPEMLYPGVIISRTPTSTCAFK